MKLYEVNDETGEVTFRNGLFEWAYYFYWWFRSMLDRELWKWLLSPPSHEEVSRWEAFKCRWGGHKCGTIYYNPGGLEPDGRCKNCYDYIG